ncbi:hypothetical protein YWIDRAFT_07565 [Streptomyces sp. SceaMP-e96]|uniref:hypothetical protein n=1 Tax=Streptomyces TaxID=1883 RepID=UPI00082379A2|nr:MULTISPECIES: hypothetical protein [unclassified Streptomyces]MYT17921.1 hypothetical protein [Streptomyces sp. SID4951]SCK47867.1 hypothetical protein YWIDRAFT_07565 [Streptomyces sp. SceaMP-e96]
MHSSRRTAAADQTSRIRRTRQWIARRRTVLLSSALRGAAYATGAGLIGLAFYLIQKQL